MSLYRYLREIMFGLELYMLVFDPPGHGQIDGRYFNAWCPFVRKKQNHAATLTLVPRE